MVAAYEDDIFKPISEERLEITTEPAERSDRSGKKYTTLADQMSGFRQLVETETVNLQRLWKEWHRINLDLVWLAIEVLGPDSVELALDQHDQSISSRKNTAAAENQRHRARQTGFENKSAELIEAIRTAAKETIDVLNEQEKVR